MILGVQEVAKEDTNKYGILDVNHIEDRIYKVKDMVEKPDVDKAPSNIAILGRYIITPDIFDILENQEPGKGGEIQLTDADEPFAVILGDDIVDSEVPCLKQLINAYDEYKTTVLGVQEVERENTDKYGILDVKHIENRVYKVKDMVEKPNVEDAPSNIAILGRYIITPEIFNILENQEPGKGGEIQLTDALQTLATKEAIYAYNFEGRRYDVGDKLGFLEATVDFALKREELREEFMEFLRSKVELEDIKSSKVAVTVE